MVDSDCGPGCICKHCCTDEQYLDYIVKTKNTDIIKSKSLLHNDDSLSARDDFIIGPMNKKKSYMLFHYCLYFQDPTYLKKFCSLVEQVLLNKSEVDPLFQAISTKNEVRQIIPFFSTFKAESFEIIFLDYFLFQPNKVLQYFQTNCGGIKDMAQLKHYLNHYLKFAVKNTKTLQSNLAHIWTNKVEYVQKLYKTTEVASLTNTFPLIYEHLYVHKQFVYKDVVVHFKTFIVDVLLNLLFDECNLKFDLDRFVIEQKSNLSIYNDLKLKSKSNREQFITVFSMYDKDIQAQTNALHCCFEPGM